MQNKARLFKTLILSGSAVLITYLFNFILTPFITDRIGIDAYGFVSIAKTAVSYASIITISLTSFIVRFVSVSYHEKNLSEASKYYSSSVYACFVFSGAIFLVACLIISRLEYLLIIPESIQNSVKILFVLVFFNFILNTVVTPYSTATYIKNRLDYAGIVKIGGYILEAIAMAVMFKFLQPSVWYVGFGTTIASGFILVCNYYMQRKFTPELNFSKKNISIIYIKNIIKNGIWNSINQLGNVLNGGLDLIISNLMLSGVAMGQIAVTKTISTMFNTLYATIFQPFQPQLLKSYAEGDKNKLTLEITRIMKFCGYFSNIAFAGFVSLGGLYYELWLPNQDTYLLHNLTILTVLGSITAGVIQPIYYINTLTLKNKVPCWITISGGIVNLLAMYVLLKTTSLGPYAVVVTTSIVMISINLFFNPVYSAKCLGISPKPFYIVIFRHLSSVAVMTGVFIAITRILNPYSWIGLIGSALVLSFVGLMIHIIIVCNREEISYLIKKLLNRIKKQ